jgi:hypothetical protein
MNLWLSIMVQQMMEILLEPLITSHFAEAGGSEPDVPAPTWDGSLHPKVDDKHLVPPATLYSSSIHTCFLHHRALSSPNSKHDLQEARKINYFKKLYFNKF